MSVTASAGQTAERAPGRAVLFWRSFAENRGAVLGLAVMVGLVVLALFADVVAPHAPTQLKRTGTPSFTITPHCRQA